MIAFYSRDGQFIASVEDGVGGIMVTGNVDFLMQISQGNPTWNYFRTNLMAVDRDDWQSLVIPDGTVPPETFAEALLLAVAQPELELERMKFEFTQFSGFGSVGPLLLQKVPQEFEAVIASDPRFSTDIEARTELLRLRDYHQRLAADSDRWDSYLEDLNDDDLALGDHIYFEKPDSPATILVELGRGLWVQLERSFYSDELDFIEFHVFDATGSDSDILDGLAQVLDSLHAGYSAAIELVVDPHNLAEDYDLYGDEEEEYEDEDRPIWGLEIYELWQKYCMTFDMRTVELFDALKERSPQFAELARILKNPSPDEYQRLVRAAREIHPGFGGELGMFDDWAGPRSTAGINSGHIALYATYEFNGTLWAEVGLHALVSPSGDVSTKQFFVDHFSLGSYSELDGKFGLGTPLETRPIVDASLSSYKSAKNIAQKIQYLVDEFDSIPESDHDARSNFSWNDGETDEILAEMGEAPTRFSTPRFR